MEQYNPPDPITYFTGEYENNNRAKNLGNTEKEMALYSVEQGQYILPEEQIIRRSVIIWGMSPFSGGGRFVGEQLFGGPGLFMVG